VIDILVDIKKGKANIHKKELDLTNSLLKASFLSLQDLSFVITEISPQLLINLFSIHLKENKLLVEALNLFLESFG